jgi:hypothetical protein
LFNIFAAAFHSWKPSPPPATPEEHIASSIRTLIATYFMLVSWHTLGLKDEGDIGLISAE